MKKRFPTFSSVRANVTKNIGTPSSAMKYTATSPILH